MKVCSVVIPCYNNQEVIELTLSALVTQIVPDDWQLHIIVVDDGSTDSTVHQAQAALQHTHWPHTLLTESHHGISHTRNHGLAIATGTIVLFINADTVLQPGAVAAHLHFHDTHPEVQYAALGFIAWDPRVNPSPLMEWLVHGGPQNDFDALLGQTVGDARHFFSAAHVSLKRSLVEKQLFSLSFTYYGWEDIELGRRLAEQGLQLYILATAQAWHHHRYTATAVAARQRAVGRGLHVYQALYPHLQLGPVDSTRRQIKHRLFAYTGASWIVNQLVTLVAERWSWPWLFQLWTSWYFWQGWRAKRGSNT